MNLMKSLKHAAAVVMLLSAGVANAAYQYTLTGDYSASWQLSATMAPDYDEEGVGFVLYDIEGNFPGSWLNYVDLTFYHADIGGGLVIEDYYGGSVLLLTDGPQLYSGLEGAPTLLLGTFALSEYEGTGSYTLTVTDLDAPVIPVDPVDPSDVPEPASAMLLLGGLGLLAASRKRRAGR